MRLGEHPLCIVNRPVRLGEWAILSETGWYDLRLIEKGTCVDDTVHWGDVNPFELMMSRLEAKIQAHRDMPIVLATHYVPFWELMHIVTSQKNDAKKATQPLP